MTEFAFWVNYALKLILTDESRINVIVFSERCTGMRVLYTPLNLGKYKNSLEQYSMKQP